MEKMQQLAEMAMKALQRQKYTIAVDEFKKAIDVDEKSVDAYAKFAESMIYLGEYQEAMQAVEKVLLFDPNHKECLKRKTQLLINFKKHEEAAVACYKLMSVDPTNPEHACILAKTFSLSSRNKEAIDALHQNLEKYPIHWNSRMDLGIIYFLQGDIKNGFAEFEYRLQNSKLFPYAESYPVPLWRGEKIEGKTLLIRWEQGFGDSIQFLRYIPYLYKYDCKIIIDLQPALHCLFKDLKVQLINTEMEPTPSHDVYILLMSLPYIFETDLSTIPPPITINISRTPIKNRIGIVWKGNPQHPKNRKRTMDLKLFDSLFQIKEMEFISLQKDSSFAEAQFLDDYGVKQPKLDSFEDTALELAKCERVICVDTSVAHLAGSMGVPAWILTPYEPDWRWFLDRQDSPWYPSVRLFRQSVANSWKEPLEEVKCCLMAKM